MSLSKLLGYSVIFSSIALSGCSNIHWSLSHPIPDTAEESVNNVTYADTKNNNQWLDVFHSIASDSKAKQLAHLQLIDELLKKGEMPDLMLQKAMLYAFGSKIKNTPKALRLFEAFNASKGEHELNDAFPRAAVVMLTEIKSKAGKRWLLKQEISQLMSRTEETETYVRMLENKLRAIESIEESIHQRKK